MATSTGSCLKAQSAMLYINELNGESRLCLVGVNIRGPLKARHSRTALP